MKMVKSLLPKTLMIFLFFRIILINCVKFQPSGFTPFNCFVQKRSFPYTPQYQTVFFLLQQL